MTGIITADYVRAAILERARDVHKGDCGRILVIAGSKGMAGAAILCGMGALRAGAGLVKIALPEELYPIVQIALPEAVCVPRRLSKLEVPSFDAVVIGPGLGDDAENEGLVLRVLAECAKTVVLDADGLNALAKDGKTRAIRQAVGDVIITPHIGEARRLVPHAPMFAARPEFVTGQGSTSLTTEDRLGVAGALLAETGAIVVLKGADTIVAHEKEGMALNTTGNPGMATGGSGDVLAGIIAALSKQVESPWDAAQAGVYIHGRAGDLAAAAMGERGMTAMDIASKTALAVKEMTEPAEKERI